MTCSYISGKTKHIWNRETEVEYFSCMKMLLKWFCSLSELLTFYSVSPHIAAIKMSSLAAFVSTLDLLTRVCCPVSSAFFLCSSSLLFVSFWSYKCFPNFCWDWAAAARSFFVIGRLKTPPSALRWSQMMSWATRGCSCKISTSASLLTENPLSTDAWPCESTNKIFTTSSNAA